MGILQEILQWANDLPKWQSDALARLLARQTLTPEDLGDLFALLKAAHGIPDPKGRTPKPLTADQIPVPVEKSKQIALLAMKNMRNVNAVAPNKRLPFAATGLTVIYGDNGSGKSGYSRVLKRACRARDQTEVIHPNANLPESQTGRAEADFEVLRDGTPQDLHWKDGETAPVELSALAIFDSRCARAYLDNEDDFCYVPYGLDVLEGLARVCVQMKAMIEAEYARCIVDVSAFVPLQGETAVGKLIVGLSAETKPAEIEALATLSEKETAQYAELDRSLKENNPKEKAGQLRLRARRIAMIAASVTSKYALVDPAVVAKLRNLVESLQTAQATAALAAQELKKGEILLPGTGGEVWREMFEAARKFAIESHPERGLSGLSADDRCPLCQQPLAQGADRLGRFEAFIQQEAEKRVQTLRTTLATERQRLAAQVLAINLDDITYSEIEAMDPQLAKDSRAFEQALIAHREKIVNAVESCQWDGVNTELPSPAGRLEALAKGLNTEAETLEKASDEKARAALQKQFAELAARMRLGEVKGAILTAVSQFGQQKRLRRCLDEVKTYSISMKSTELAEKVVSKGLADALNDEFKALGVGQLCVSPKSRSAKGKPLHRLKLELAQTHYPGDILSEGEQRAVAIGSFLAEVNLSGSKEGIVFDDPVSSLDHRRRERVADRLVQEATKRQVIVFTHDIYFLCILVETAQATGTPIMTWNLVREPEGFGVPDPELPFEGKNVKQRIGALKDQCQIIAKLHRSGNEQECRRQTIEAYVRLGMAWERGVEEVLICEVVLRFRKGIETQRLSEVVVEDTDYAQVDAAMTKCSNYAHDKACMGGVAVPEPGELLKDIQELDDWRERIEKRSKETAQRRKK